MFADCAAIAAIADAAMLPEAMLAGDAEDGCVIDTRLASCAVLEPLIILAPMLAAYEDEVD